MFKSLFIIFFSMILLFPGSVSANDKDIVVSLHIDNPIMEINGIETEIDLGRGTKPLIINGKTLVPIRAIIEAYGGTVEWDQNNRTVWLYVEDDIISLKIDHNIAYLNEQPYTLDVSPTIINGRTMLPIRFVAEGFNFGVAWAENTKTVYIIKNAFENHEYEYLKYNIPEYTAFPYAYVNNNIPLFKEYEIISASFEYYSDLDSLGRCNVCMSSVSKDTMPDEKRESISSVIPTGWKNVSYDLVEGGYLYNRCHLIGFQLTGENANDRNLITGTRYMNIEGMLPFENMVDDYIETTGNHVMYRATPVFESNNLVAHGVLLEAYSVEDSGAGISFCVYCYNVQPGISIDYSTGSNSADASENIFGEEIYIGDVYMTPTGKRYHIDRECGGKNSFKTTLEIAVNKGLTPCQKCLN